MSGFTRRQVATVVVLDDDHGSRLIVRLTLAAAGYHVVSLMADSGTLREIRAVSPAVILVDVWDLQPGRGLRVLDELQADAVLRDIPVVALSVQGDRPELRARYRGRGCSAVLPKPFDRDDLRATVADVVLAANGMPSTASAVR